MANKSSREQRVKQNRRKIYEQLCAKLNIFYYIALALSVVLLVSFFFYWNHASANGTVEFKPTGWTFFAVTISNSFTAPNEIGNIIYHVAPDHCVIIGLLTVISVALIIVIIALLIVTIVSKNHKLSFALVALEAFMVIFLFATWIVALIMNNKIFIEYCLSNPACKLYSLVILPVIISVGLLVVNSITVAKYLSARKYLY